MTQRPFPVVQTVLRTLEIPLLQFVARFVLSLQDPQVHFWDMVIDLPVVCNVRCWVRRLRRLWNNLLVFYVQVDADPEVRSLRCGNLFFHEPFVSGSHFPHACPVYEGIWKNFTAFST